jgi:L-ascorbate metabolism protein UlaG (beta-lactamase superfamily)
MRKINLIAPAALVAAALAACTGASSTPTAALATPSPTAADTLTISYGENAQLELTAPTGERIFFDVWDPTAVTVPPTARDILLVSHLHTDHYSAQFVDSFPGQKIVNQAGELTAGTTKVVSIDASHDQTPIVPGDAANHIFVVEFAGWKIVHLGSTGQAELTPEQKAAIGGDVDLAMGSFLDLGAADPTASHEIDILDSIQPRLVMYTHARLENVQAAAQRWAAVWSDEKAVTVPKSELPAETTILCMGQTGPSYGTILKAPKADW